LISSASTTSARIGPPRYSKSPVFWLKDVDAGDVRRQQVGRELDAAEGAAERARQRLGQHRLADARHIFQQHVPVAEERDQQQLDHGVLADDHAVDLLDQAAGCCSDVGNL
jgi:hypothetical protein